MHLSQLRLSNFRNFRHLDLALPPGLCLFVGDNAQGKTNLLEAVYLLATASSPRATADGELISSWANERQDPFFAEGAPLARLAGRVERSASGGGPLTIEILWHRSTEGEPRLQKRIRVNDLPRRAVDLMGQVLVVLFSPEDLALVGGPPQGRRRYLDGMNSLLDGRYRRAWQRYQQVLARRNHLLRLIREGQARPQELQFWDEQLVEAGAYLVRRRRETVQALNPLAGELHARLHGEEILRLDYQPHVPDNQEEHDPAALHQRFLQALEAARAREIAQGMSLVGPHRDDLRFELGGVDAGVYASRGQQRTITVTLKLAEAAFLAEAAGESPIILLDDVLSELDALRRHHLLRVTTGYGQVLITATDRDRFEADLPGAAALFAVCQGQVKPSGPD